MKHTIMAVLLLAIVILTLALLGCGGPNYKLAFVTDRHTTESNHSAMWEIYTINADGSDSTRLTNNTTHDSYPSWSPDGTKIAFISRRDGRDAIYVMNADGTEPTKIVDNAMHADPLAWSPYGTKIAFIADWGNNWSESHYDIWVVDADGSNKTNLTGSVSGGCSQPVWSPDGSKIGFTSDSFDPTQEGGSFITEIYVVNSDGTELTELYSSDARVHNPIWSPDGTKIAFGKGFNDAELYIMNADGTGLTKLTDTLSWRPGHAWSPDGTKIVFPSIGPDYDIWVVDSDGSNLTRLTDDPDAYDFEPIWSPDGQKIAFVRKETKDDTGHSLPSNVFVMNADGTGLKQLTQTSSNEESFLGNWGIVWCPEPS